MAGGVALALLFAQSKWIELGLFPYAIVLQVTPIIAIAPLILIYVDNTHVALVLCAWIVAFFPILANTTLGLNSADHNLVDLFRLQGATRWQTLRYLRIPTALPYFFGGLRIAGGLALIGAVVAEFTAGTGGARRGPRVSDSRGRLPAQHSADVRGARAHHRIGHRDIRRADRAVAPRLAALARKRGDARRLANHPGGFRRSAIDRIDRLHRAVRPDGVDGVDPLVEHDADERRTHRSGDRIDELDVYVPIVSGT